ncbi:hypothetical protein TGME49_240500 [Toxoplasma gondii ME49]|uniref:PITH domain protein n=2 Tax=Toxoplasma gondii TaxID=5811 RepID=A0A125YRS8_TOXGV|nr:hypothetical protein TGME49_240500 [Toxoplasma gondii ME49]EPT30701.1 hypothetical protein TGME49_240500 [Toxoplasma gondii ME49]ESS31447.1 PITH domain protein [Toxoplasma gondii VEG]CEL73394.1 TPA: hypothetical protein BN1205_090800 [Toxoplasma gondii VEG]|eukprot:XP_018637616.1 hypothetical protein TGME49_240500 [Toxoplasma gondii ME49]
MANIDSTAANTNRMREHMSMKQMQAGKQQEQEEDLCMCYNVVNFKLSVCLNQLEPTKQVPCQTEEESGTSQPPSAEGAGSLCEGSAESETTHQAKPCADTSAAPEAEAYSRPEASSGSGTSPSNSSGAIDSRNSVVLATLQDVLLANPTDKCLVSDVDEQLLINVFFNSPVRITSMAIRSTAPPANFDWRKPSTTDDDEDLPEEGTISEPKLMKVYSNNTNLDFSTVYDETPAQVITLTPGQLKGEERLLLRGSKFQRCSSLHIFIEKNQANSIHTFINRISLYGYVNKNYAS